MAWPSRQRGLLLAAFAAGLFACGMQAANAAETSYCIVCKNPDQTYLCQVNAGGSRPSDALKLYCIIRTAKDGGHSSCSAARASGGCNGIAKVYSYDGAIPEDLASDPRVKKFTDKLERERKTFEQPKGNQPKTLVELGRRSVSASRQGLRDARSRFGGSSEEIHQSQELNQSLPNEPLSYDPAPLAAESAPPLAPEASQPNRAQRAGSAVGGFARKSYRCVASLFRKCSEEPVDGDALR
jgi:hypothetical protein